MRCCFCLLPARVPFVRAYLPGKRSKGFCPRRFPHAVRASFSLLRRARLFHFCAALCAAPWESAFLVFKL